MFTPNISCKQRAAGLLVYTAWELMCEHWKDKSDLVWEIL
jgi:hypothetical protein